MLKKLIAFVICWPLWAAVPNVTSLTWEVEHAGSDTANAACFDSLVTLAGRINDGAATVANTSAPVFTSASYNFVAGDVGAWLFIASGTNWTPGWYKIASVASNAATLDAAIGHGTLMPSLLLSTVVGVATVASPTAATWSVDYSQQAAPQYSFTNLSAPTTTTLTTVSHSFGKNDVGNCIVITAGTGFTTGTYEITAASGGTATVERAVATGGSTNGSGAVGGALATVGQPYTLAIANANTVWVKADATYVTTAGTNQGINLYQNYQGYTSFRGDGGHPTVQLSGGSLVGMFTHNPIRVEHFTVDCASQAGSIGFAPEGGGSYINDIDVKACTSYDFFAGAGSGQRFRNIVAETVTAAGTEAIYLGVLNVCDGCVVPSGANKGIEITTSTCIHCIVGNITGASSDCYVINATGGADGSNLLSSVGYKCGRDGLRILGGYNYALTFENNIFYGNAGWGLNANGQQPTGAFVASYLDRNGYGSNTSGNVNGFFAGPNDVTLTADPFVNGASNNFALNGTAGGGKSLVGKAFPGVLAAGGTGISDIGALQTGTGGSSPAAFAYSQ